MSNPRLMADDVAHHYMEIIRVEYPHSQNIRKYLRTPLLAITRRILLPRMDYAKIEQKEEVGAFDGHFHSDPTVMQCKEGLDWRDYVSSGSLSTDDNKSETEVSDSDDNQRIHQYYKKRQPEGEIKLSRRSLARMEAFLASCAIAIPDNSFYQQTRMVQSAKNNNNESNEKSQVIKSLRRFANNFSSTKQGRNANTPRPRNEYQQMDIDDLTTRLELYIHSLRRIYGLRQQSQQKSRVECSNELIECVVHYDTPRTIKARVHIVIESLVNRTNSVGSMRPILKKLLTYLTRELLAVEHLNDELNNHINKIALEYEHLTSFASLAFLSSPENSAETNLAPLLYNYVEYLRSEWEMCVDGCKLETSLARAIHPGMRHVFKTSEFLSIGHLLEVCNGYKDQLENIIIRDCNLAETSAFRPSNPTTTPDAISSAASGDEIDVKNCNTKTTKAIKQALKDLRREIITVNGHLLPPARTLTELVKLLRERLNSRTVQLKDKKQTVSNGKVSAKEKNMLNAHNEAASDSGTSRSSTDIEVESSSGNEADISDGSLFKTNGKNNDPENPISHKSKRRHFNVEAIDIMTRRLLIAASRTRTGGDAYFVVRDLFGGEGVEVIASTISSMGPYVQGKISPTIELSVRLASIMIKCHSTFNVFPGPYSGDSEPLIQLRTTTTEIIDLQEVRVGEDGNELKNFNSHENEERNGGKRKATRLMLKEKITENSGRKILSIRPAKYERIDDWRTPS